MTATIRPLGVGDLDAAIALLRAVNLTGAIGNLARYLAWQPACGWVADDDGELVGSVTVLRQGAIGFVGCMAVAPARQGGGLGRRLLEHAHAEGRRAGLTAFLLEATPAGEPLYARLGYVTTGETVIAARAASGPPAARAIAATDRAAVLALDRAATGLVRDDMIGGLVDERGPGMVVQAATQLAGFGLAVGERLGPIIARDAGAGRALVDALVAPCSVVGAPASNAAAMRALAAHGFVEARRLRRMHLGPGPAAPRDHVWALASPGAG